jgi:hypothetical protein
MTAPPRGRGAYLSSACTAIKRNGEPCTLPSTGSSGLCWAHDPANAERRRRGQSRGGKNKPSKELAATKSQLQDIADKVLAGELERGAAAVAGQLLNIKLRALEIERKIKETDELQARLEALEEALEREGAGRWGA